MDSREQGPPPTALTSDREQRTWGVIGHIKTLPGNLKCGSEKCYAVLFKAIKPKNSHSFYKDIYS